MIPCQAFLQRTQTWLHGGPAGTLSSLPLMIFVQISLPALPTLRAELGQAEQMEGGLWLDSVYDRLAG